MSERARPGLDPPPDEMRRLGYLAVDRIVEHLNTLSEQPVVRIGGGAELAACVDEPAPQDGLGFEDSLRFFFERVVPRMTRVSHPRFHAYVPCPGSFYGALGELLAAGTNPFVGSWVGGATLAALELVVLRWIAEAVGYPTSAAGVLTSGGSLANLTALAAARAHHGRFTLERGVLYLSEQGHASVAKAARLLGYPESSIRLAPTDDCFRLDLKRLERAVAEDRWAGRFPFLVCANAGTTNTGAVDPLAELAELCAREGLWLHVDAAYGGFAALCERGRALLRGMELADSLTLDPHKWLYAPMGVGCVLVRRRGALEDAFVTAGEYLKDVPRDEVNFFDRGPELSRPARVLPVWTLVRSVGLGALARQVELDLELAVVAQDLLAEEPRFEIVTPAQLSVVTFRHRARPGESEAMRAARDAALMQALLQDGTVLLSSTELRGESALRLVVMNHRTDEAQVRRSVAKIRELAVEIAS